MLGLPALTIFVGMWKRAIRISDKLSPKTWQILSIFSASLFILSVWVLLDLRLPKTTSFMATTGISDKELQSRNYLAAVNANNFYVYRDIDLGLNHAFASGVFEIGYDLTHATSVQMEARSPRGAELQGLHSAYIGEDIAFTSFPVSTQAFGAGFNQSSSGLDDNVTWQFTGQIFIASFFVQEAKFDAMFPSHYSGSSNLNLFSELNLQDFARFFRQAPEVFVQAAPSEKSNFKKDLLFWMSLFGMVVSTATSLATIIFTWISLHRRQAEAILLRLELEKRRLEIEQLRLELERARLETDKQNAGLIIVPG